MAKARRSSKKLRVGFIGAGGIADTHAKHYAQMDDVELVSACDIVEANRKRFQENHGVRKCYVDWRKMLRAERLDAVSVCTPNFLHCQPTLDALNAGCHVLVEKPLAMNARQGRRMVETAKRKRRQLVIGFQYRYDGRTQALRKAVQDGFFGKILYVRVQAMRRRGIPNWGVFGRKDLQGGGPLIDIGVHCLETAHYTIGSPEPIAASGSTWTYLGNKPSAVASQWPNWDYKKYTVEDLAVGAIRTKNGPVIHVESCFAAHLEQSLFTFQMFGEKGGATWEPFRIFHDEAGLMLNSTPAFAPKVDIWPYKMRHFVEVCLYGRRNEAPGEHGLMIQKMLDGIYASAEAGKEIRIR